MREVEVEEGGGGGGGEREGGGWFGGFDAWEVRVIADVWVAVL